MKHIKVVTIGDRDVGKTDLLISYTINAYPSEFIPTVFDNYSSNIMVEDQAINLQLWDTSGQEDFIKLRPLSYPHTDVFLALFSVVNPRSLENIENIWIPEIKEHRPEATIVLVGTNTHLRDEFHLHEAEYISKGWKPIPKEKGEEMKQKIGAYDYIECDSFKQFHLKEVFESAVKSFLHSPASETPKERKKRLKAEKKAEKEERKKNKKKFHINFHFGAKTSSK